MEPSTVERWTESTILFKLTFNKAFWKYYIWHASTCDMWPITSDIHLTWEIRYERHTKSLIICTIQLWRAYTSNQDDTGHFDHQGCHNQGCKAEVYSWGEGGAISELLRKDLLRELILRGTFLHTGQGRLGMQTMVARKKQWAASLLRFPLERQVSSG